MRRTHNGWNETAQNEDPGGEYRAASTMQKVESAAMVGSPSATGPDGVVDAIPGDVSTSYSVTIGGAGASGWISPLGDRDWYAVTLTAGQTYVFTLNGSGGSPLQDTYLRLHNAAGTQVAFDDDSGPGTYSLLSYTAPSSGTFYLDAGAFGDSSSGQYTLSASLVEGASDSIAATTATAATVAIDSPAFGSINTIGDHDWYAITLSAGQTYQFSMSSFGGSPLGSATLNLRDASGALIAEGAGSSVTSLVTFAATSSGVYYLDAGATNDASTGGYALSASSYSGFVVHLIYDAAALSAPQSFRDGIQAAADILHSMIADNVTVNLNITYQGTGGGASAGPDSGLFESYSQVRNLLVNLATPGDHLFDTLPQGSTIGGQSQVVVWNAELRVLGLLAANDPSSDGSATFATDISPSLLVGVALHELTHALGRVQNAPQPDILEFFRFTSAGNYLFDNHTPASASSYFSIDGGVTRLANFGVSSDPSDFLNSGGLTPNDPFNEFYGAGTSQSLTPADMAVMEALGYHVFNSINPDLIAQSATLSGSSLSFTVRDIGNRSAAASTSAVYLSPDSSVSTGDFFVGTSSTGALPSYGSERDNIALAFSGAQAPGTYYLAAITDYDGKIIEGNDVNNASNVIPVILGNNGTNTVAGTASADHLFALGGNDTLIGGGGNDTLNGGLGVDTANYASPSTSDSWHRNPDGTWTVGAGSEGTDTVSGVEFLHFTDRTVHLDLAKETLFGDGTSDILFRNVSANGATGVWAVQGSTITTAATIGFVGSDWTLTTTGDFNGDGKDDLIWLHAGDGVAAEWQMDGASPTSSAVIGGVGSDWHIVGSGDFNRDGISDLLWRANDGTVAVWNMNGYAPSSAAVIGQVDANWQVWGVADFDGDGHDEILWRHSNGLVATWSTDGSAITGAANIGYVDTSWTLAGTGDFNGDGKADILWVHGGDGAVVIWEMTGSTIQNAGLVGSVGSAWHVANVGDYNGDGMDDILWRHDNGVVAVWTMNGTNITDAGIVGTISTDWTII